LTWGSLGEGGAHAAHLGIKVSNVHRCLLVALG
jgi:hypothetical protein